MSKYYCPRCGSKNIYEYSDSFDCASCKDGKGMPLWFDKKIFDEIEDKSSILSIQELLGIIRILKGDEQ